MSTRNLIGANRRNATPGGFSRQKYARSINASESRSIRNAARTFLASRGLTNQPDHSSGRQRSTS